MTDIGAEIDRMANDAVGRDLAKLMSTRVHDALRGAFQLADTPEQAFILGLVAFNEVLRYLIAGDEAISEHRRTPGVTATEINQLAMRVIQQKLGRVE
jgi:hypothetical protein